MVPNWSAPATASRDALLIGATGEEIIGLQGFSGPSVQGGRMGAPHNLDHRWSSAATGHGA